MIPEWKRDKDKTDTFLPYIKWMLGEVFVQAAPIEVDQKEATDYVMLDVKPYRVACRVRDYSYWQRYGGEFTIRSRRPAGTKTELDKIIDGWCDFMFYGFADETYTYIYAATLIDLKAFRAALIREAAGGPKLISEERLNKDNSSSFRAYNIAALPAGVVYAYWQHSKPPCRSTPDPTLRAVFSRHPVKTGA